MKLPFHYQTSLYLQSLLEMFLPLHDLKWNCSARRCCFSCSEFLSNKAAYSVTSQGKEVGSMLSLLPTGRSWPLLTHPLQKLHLFQTPTPLSCSTISPSLTLTFMNFLLIISSSKHSLKISALGSQSYSPSSETYKSMRTPYNSQILVSSPDLAWDLDAKSN